MANTDVLNWSGVQTLWNKIKATFVAKSSVVGEMGDDATKVMSQKSVTAALNGQGDRITELEAQHEVFDAYINGRSLSFVGSVADILAKLAAGKSNIVIRVYDSRAALDAKGGHTLYRYAAKNASGAVFELAQAKDAGRADETTIGAITIVSASDVRWSVAAAERLSRKETGEEMTDDTEKYPSSHTVVKELEGRDKRITDLDKRVDAKPNIDGYYEGMAVGYARNLIMPDTPEEQEFNFRQAGGGVIEDGVAVIDKVKGNSVVWNQLLSSAPKSQTENGITFLFSANNEFSISGTASEVTGIDIASIAGVFGHKYLISHNLQANSWGRQIIYDYNNPNNFLNGATIITASTQVTIRLRYQVWSGVSVNEKGHLAVHDLTQMFGAGNEPSTYEEFLQRKPKVADEYAYNEGEIINNKVGAVKVQGSNLATSDILLLTNLGGAEFANAFLHRGTYCISLDIPQTITLFVALFDKNGNNISGSASSLGEGWVLNSSRVWWYNTIYSGGKLSFSLAKDAIVSIKTNATLSQTTRIMLNVGTTLLPYEPYEEHTLALDWVKAIKDENGAALLPDGLRSAGSAYDEVRGGKAVKRIGVVDLGELDWTMGIIGGNHRFVTNIASMAIASGYSERTTGILSAKYATDGSPISGNAKDMVMSRYEGSNLVYVADFNPAYTDGAKFKEANQGVKLYYELATPIEVEYDEKNLTYPVVAGGTEEAISTEDSSAFRADIGYGIDAVKTILKLKERVTALENK